MHIEIHYLPSLEYMTILLQNPSLLFEVEENFPKQTYRNRCLILGANGVERLSVPVVHLSGEKTKTKNTKIDYSQNWIKQHQGAIRAAYGNAPYYEYFEPYLSQIFAKKRFFLVDLNIDLLSFVYRILDVPLVYKNTNEFGVFEGLSEYDQISAKKDWQERSIYQNRSYRQCFGQEFVPNLSILDLLMNHGKESLNFLK
jgi:hypothetical protein